MVHLKEGIGAVYPLAVSRFVIGYHSDMNELHVHFLPDLVAPNALAGK